MKGKMIAISSLILLIIAAVGFIFGIFFFGFIGLFSLLGVQYDSLLSVVFFVVAFFILGFFVDIFIKVIVRIFHQNGTSRAKYKLILFLLSFIANWGIITLIEMMMNSVTIADPTIIIIALFVAVLDVVFDDEDLKHESEQ